jgi:thiol-disulfide isomerase/thioredoxin/DNA-binding beta-propeller fold protein YncE
VAASPSTESSWRTIVAIRPASVVWLIAAALVAGLLVVYGAQRKQEGRKMIPAGAMDGIVNAPEFPTGLDWLNTSTPLRLRDLRGKFVLLDFWTYCCINCMHILPDLEKLETKYSQELVIIGVHSAKFKNERDTSQIRSAILRYGIRHPVVNDSSFEVWQLYGANAWPTVELINPLGKIITKFSGEGVYQPIDTVLSQAIPYFEKKGQLKRSPLKLTLEAAKQANTLLEFPGKISSDEKSGRLFISDSNHNRILIARGSGEILDVIGSGDEGRADGSFEDAQFHHPQGAYLSGETLYIADTENHLVRAADLTTRKVTTVLGTGWQAQRPGVSGRGLSVDLNSPWDLLALDGKMYIAMAGAHQLWVADLGTWEARAYAGSGREEIIDGPLADAALAQPSGITTDGRNLYFADSESSSIREAGLTAGARVQTLVGKGLFEFGDVEGDAGKARLQHPLGVAFHNGLIYVADTYNSKIKVIDPARRTAAAFAGSGKKADVDGKFSDAAFNEPGGLAWLAGKLYVADTNNQQIRILDPVAKSVTSLEFKGLEKLSHGRMDRFRGRIVDLGEREIRAGAATLALNVVLPAGYKFNTDAPFYMRWRVRDGSALRFGLDADKVDFKHVRFPLDVPIERVNGRSDVTIDTVVYYCTSQSSACYVDPIRVTLELKPSDSGPSTAPVDIPVKTPGALAPTAD